MENVMNDYHKMRQQAQQVRNRQQVESSPLYIACQSCGAPADFDIIHQNYHCQHCGSVTDVNTTLAFVENWRQQHKEKLLQSTAAQNLQKEIVSCSNCGAQVVLPAGEVTAKCDFCGGKLVRKEFNQQEYFPEIIIPFFITKEEAKKQLDKWLEENKNAKEAKTIQQHCKRLEGYYLPYQVVQGCVSCEIFRDVEDSYKKYRCRGYIKNVAVNSSKQMDNAVLNAMEPFDWTKAVPFEYSFLAGQRAKMQDIDNNKLHKRTLEEVSEAYLPTIEKTLHTTGVTVISSMESKDWSLSALLPAYVWQGQGLKLAINGQTGRVAVKVNKQKKSYPWLIEPTALTLAITVIAYMAIKFSGMDADPLELAGMIGLVFGMIIFTIYGSGRKALYRTKYLQSQEAKAERDRSDKLVLHKTEPTKQLTPVFVEKIDGKDKLVQLSFYSASRITGLMAMVLLWNVFPLLMVLPLSWAAETKPDYVMLAPWWCISVSISIVWLIKLSRVSIFDFPIMRIIKKDGSLSPVVSKSFYKGLMDEFGPVLKYLFWGLTIFAFLFAALAVS